MDWELESVAAAQCGISTETCRSISRLLNDGCTIPFICRYRSSQISHASPDVVREVQSSLDQLQKVADKAVRVMKRDVQTRAVLAQAERGAVKKTPKELETLRASLLPSSVQQSIVKCTDITDLNSLISPFTKQSKSSNGSKTERFKRLGLETVALNMMNGCGQKYSLPGTAGPAALAADAPLAFAEMKVEEAVKSTICLIGEIIAKDAATFTELKALCDQIPPIISSVKKKKSTAGTASKSPKSTSSSKSSKSSNGRLKTVKKKSKTADEDPLLYERYFDFKRNVKQIEAHQVLAVNRGEKEGVLSVSVDFSEMFISRFLRWCATGKFGALKLSEPIMGQGQPAGLFADVFNLSTKSAWTTLIKPQLSRRIRSEIKKEAEKFGVKIFSRNLRFLLLSPPLCHYKPFRGRVVMGIDPGFVNSCKIAILSPLGEKILHTCELKLHVGLPDFRAAEAEKLRRLIGCFNVGVVAVGDGTAARETEAVLSQILSDGDGNSSSSGSGKSDESFTIISNSKRQKTNDKDESTAAAAAAGVDSSSFSETGSTKSSSSHCRPPPFVLVNEQGVSIWSVTKAAEEELPMLPPNLRSAVSIARRLIDPLCEYTKVEPQNLGLGIYQKDIPESDLAAALSSIVEECVSLIGLDINTAPLHLLRSIAGLGPSRAAAIIEHRNKHGRFVSRDQIKQVKGIADKIFQQCSGFLRIRPSSSLKLQSSTAVARPASSAVAAATANVGLSRGVVESDSCLLKAPPPSRKRKRTASPEQQQDQLYYQVNSFAADHNAFGCAAALSEDVVMTSPAPDSVVPTGQLLSSVTPLDNTWIHPEHYKIAQSIVDASGTSLAEFESVMFKEKILSFCKMIPEDELQQQFQVDKSIIKLIVDGLTNPSGFVDLRDQQINCAPFFKQRVFSLEEIIKCKTSVIKGRVKNVTSFGVFVDVGVGTDGLIPLNYLSKKQKLEELVTGQTISCMVVDVCRQESKRPRITLQFVEENENGSKKQDNNNNNDVHMAAVL